MNKQFYDFSLSLVISRLMMVLIHPDPASNRHFAILVVQFSNSTTTQEFTGGLAVLAVVPDRIAFSVTAWEVPWPVRVNNRPPDTQASPAMQVCLRLGKTVQITLNRALFRLRFYE